MWSGVFKALEFISGISRLPGGSSKPPSSSKSTEQSEAEAKRKAEEKAQKEAEQKRAEQEAKRAALNTAQQQATQAVVTAKKQSLLNKIKKIELFKKKEKTQPSSPPPPSGSVDLSGRPTMVQRQQEWSNTMETKLNTLFGKDKNYTSEFKQAEGYYHCHRSEAGAKANSPDISFKVHYPDNKLFTNLCSKENFEKIFEAFQATHGASPPSMKITATSDVEKEKIKTNAWAAYEKVYGPASGLTKDALFKEAPSAPPAPQNEQGQQNQSLPPHP